MPIARLPTVWTSERTTRQKYIFFLRKMKEFYGKILKQTDADAQGHRVHLGTFPVLENVGHLVGIIHTKRFPSHTDEDIGAEFFLVVEIAILVVEVLVLHTVVVRTLVAVGESCHYAHMDSQIDFEAA